jgi:N-acetylneuraminic acid mutarotase
MRPLGQTGLVILLVSACAAPSREPVAAPSPSPSPTREQLCQPFPDRLIDEFLAAYEDRDLDALEELFHVQAIHDTGAVAHAQQADFSSVEEWAEAGWATDDRLDLTGYGAFAGTNDGFTMYIVRRNDGLRGTGIEQISMLLHARSSGCLIDELGSVGPIQARGAPCGFYESFRDHPAVSKEEPLQCADGSGGYARLNHAAVWTGSQMIVVGGNRGGSFRTPDVWETGLRYVPGTGWAATAEAPQAARGLNRAAWTGREVLLWGGYYDEAGAAAYDPSSDSWRRLRWPLEDPESPPGVWTGSRLVVWGSSSHSDRPQRVGAVYDPSTGLWTRTSDAPLGGCSGHTAVWTGREVIVWGGSNFRTDLDDGAAYDPSSDTWRRISAGPLRSRQDHTAIWTGMEMVVFGGTSFSSSRADGAAYDPATDTWRRIAPFPLERRHWHTAVWTGHEMVVWGGHSYRTNEPQGDGAAYNPLRDEWRVLPVAPIDPRCHHSAVWTGEELVIYGGYDDCESFGHIPFGDGAAYDPGSDSWRRLNPAM